MRPLIKYSFANAKIRAMLSDLLKPETVSALLETSDSSSLLEALRKTPYLQILEKIDTENLDLKILEKELLKADIASFRKVYGALSTQPEKELVGLFLERFQIDDLKVALRIWHKKAQVDPDDYISEPNISYPIDYSKIIRAATIDEIILSLDGTPYREPLSKVKDKFLEHDSSFYLEASLDVDYYTRLNTQAGKLSGSDKAIARKILGVAVDIENINWLIRSSKNYSLGVGQMLDFVLPGGRKLNKDTVRKYYTTDGANKIVENIALGSYAGLKDLAGENAGRIENILYEVLAREIKAALTGFPFTIGTVLGYLFLKRSETRNIISLLNAKDYGWSKKEVEPLLRP